MSLLPDPARPLDEGAAAAAFAAIFDGKVADDALANFLTTLADRGETVGEIVAAARALRARTIQPFRAADALDVCGTGGDGMHSLNISTAVSLVVAACGVKLAKHGNRAEARSVGQWLRHGWHVAVGYVLGFFVLLAVLGWHPEPLRRTAVALLG